MVFYRKYRPQKIDELDNEVVRETLHSIFSKKDFPHAFLFTGQKGLGKTSTARIVAKVINCTAKKTTIEPCNKCDSCISITNGSNLDVFEIDGASNRGIDEIRDLREKIKLAPFKAAKKVYIIDEVHMLTTEAFNALLKTLEEPPSHAVFILCTTEDYKVPATIISRCFRINFTTATNEELIRSMQRIVKNEKLKINNDALVEIARLSDGSFREGAKILEEIFMLAGQKTITKDLVYEKYNIKGVGEKVTEMLDVLAKKDLNKGLKLCRDLAKQGVDFKFFIEELIERLHLMLLIEAGVEKVPQDGGLKILNIGEIKKLFELFSDAYQETKYAVLPQVPLELVVLEWAKDSAKPEMPTPVAAGAKTTSGQTPPHASGSSSFFNELTDEVKRRNPLVAGLLRSCSAEDIKNGKLNIITNSKFHKDKLEEPKSMKLLEESAKTITGQEVEVYILLQGVINNE